MIKAFLITLALAAITLPAFSQQQRQSEARQEAGACRHTILLKPSPFLGTANEIIVLADGSIWEDMSYKYLYLYAYNPPVIICPGQGKMILEMGGTTHTFQLMRIR